MRLSTYRNLRLPNFSVNALTDLLKEAGLDWETALREADIDPDAVSRLGGTIPARKELAFQVQFAALTADRVDLWVKAAHAYTPGAFGVRGLAFITAPTVEAWVELVTEMDDGPALLENSPLRAPDGTVSGIELTHPDAPAELVPFSVFRDFCSVAISLTWLLGTSFPFTKIEWPLTQFSSELLAYAQCDFILGADSLRLWWDPSMSTQLLPLGNAFQHASWRKEDQQLLQAVKASGDWKGTVAQAVKSAPQYNRTLANVASSLRVSPRTLQRQLNSSGHRFADVRDDTLRELASGLLLNSIRPVSEISRMLGYSDPASFAVAFKRWSGSSPSAFREGLRSPSKPQPEQPHDGSA